MTATTSNHRDVPIDIHPGEFKRIGYQLVDKIAGLLENISSRPVTPGEGVTTVQAALGSTNPLPQTGSDPATLIERATELLMDHSLYNGHPRFWGYITAPAAPIGILGDLLASAVNPNVGGWDLSPMATEIEAQVIRWISELIGFPGSGGLMVSGGNMANFVCFLVASRNKGSKAMRTRGPQDNLEGRPLIYCSVETHTWIQKAADMFGFGTDSIRWIPVDQEQRMDLGLLRSQISEDKSQGDKPFLLIGTAGTISTGAVDPLLELARISQEFDLWFHIDGAYGGFAGVSSRAGEDFKAIEQADSVAVDPHKWLYSPLEAGCALVRDPAHLRDAFSYHPSYYQFDHELINYFDYGFQNSRGFRALKVWLALQQVGREGYTKMITDDIDLAGRLFELLGISPQIETFTYNLSITTFRFVPEDLADRTGQKEVEEYLDSLNSQLLTKIQQSGEAFLSNAVVHQKFVLRACIVNFRTTEQDIRALPEIVLRLGVEVDSKRRPEDL